MRVYIVVPVVAAAVFFSVFTAARAVETRPNIIFIMVDDMGRDWISAYGSSHPTPNVDRLAVQGIRFDNCWCAPICTPTRMELLTGMYPFRTGWVRHHDVPRWGGKGFDWEKYTSFARVVKKAGYATAIGGKWQINDFRKYPDALKRHGFDEHCVWTGYETGNAPPSDKRYWDGYLMTNGKRKVHPHGSEAVNDFLIDFIRRNKDRPFLAYYPMMLVHGPFLPTPLNKANAPKGKTELYAGMVTYMDRLVGKLVTAVDELGIGGRTIIIFTGDNGSSASGTLRGKPYPKGKGRTNNWGVHMPFLVRAPMFSKGGVSTRDLIDFTDMLPTFSELAGAELPAGVKLDGRSFVSSLRGDKSAAGKREWIFAQIEDRRTIRDKRYKLDSTGAFWDLEKDYLEKNDLRGSADPEVVRARASLGKVLASLPANAVEPFEGYKKGGGKNKDAKPKRARRNKKKSGRE